MKKFNKLTEKQMSKTNGGVIFMAISAAAAFGTIIGVGVAHKDGKC